MADQLQRTRLAEGRYEAIYASPDVPPIELVLNERVLGVADCAPHPDNPQVTRVALDLPAEALSDGVQTLILRSGTTGAVLDRIAIAAGAALDEDLRAEIVLLRDELEMLKRAFRAHVAETSMP